MSSFIPYDYRPQFSEGSSQVGAGMGVGSSEGAGYSRGAFSYISGDTATGIHLVGWRNEKGGVYDPTADERGFGVMDKFLCIPGDGTLASMSLSLFSYTELKVFSSAFVANGLAVTVYQKDFTNVIPSPAVGDEHILYGPEDMRFQRLDNSVRTRLRPVNNLKPGLPMFLRVIAISYVVDGFLPVTKTTEIVTPEGNVPPVNTLVTTVQPSNYRLFYSIPVSISRVAK